MAASTTTQPAAKDALAAAQAELKGASAEQILAFAEKHFGARATIASSFGAEDVVLLHLAREHAPSLKVFTLDTGRLPPETYELMDVLRRRFGLSIETYFPDREQVEALESQQGYFSFRESLEARKACCAIRKVAPLKRALKGKEAWVTGMRRDQSVTRVDIEAVQLDADNGLWKFNPLLSWGSRDVWAYIRENALPYNALHDRGYPSIGCAPCTRAVKPYEDERAGRWWWESAEHKECGLHRRD